MAEEDILSDELVRRLIGVGEVDILVGIHTHNHAQTIGPVLEVVRSGLLRYFPRERVAILNADGGSTDGTRELVRAVSISDTRPANGLYVLRTLHSVSTRYEGDPSNRTALRTIIAAAELLNAKACAVISPDSTEMTADWIEKLLVPVYRESNDFVAPVYQRHKFEGMLVTNLVYPLTRAIYGRRLREPRPREFCFSYRFASRLLGDDFWNSDASHVGPEVCIALAALAGNLRLFQTFLGPIGRPEQQSIDLVAALRQTMTPLFWSMDRNFTLWSAIRHSEPIPASGPDYRITDTGVQVDPARLRQTFCSGVIDLQTVLQHILAPETLGMLLSAATEDDHSFCFPDELWVKVIYEFARSYHLSTISRDHIIQALVPLFRGRAYMFLTENAMADDAEMEAHVERLCLTFERCKPFLLELWAPTEGG
ncbi:MAG TPA: glycosyltransferase family 2 protein [Terriglobales bacterium]|nr:glycosyltransferase family 2 protein [Terriglobales bacterium]